MVTTIRAIHIAYGTAESYLMGECVFSDGWRGQMLEITSVGPGILLENLLLLQ